MNTKSAFVAIVGRPNVGKSSLLNAILGEKVAIVSKKPQTTRTRITGVLTEGETQLVFVDTPGLHKPRTKLSEYMVQQIKESVGEVDVAVLVSEPVGEIYKAEYQLMENFRMSGIPVILAINKIDTLVDKSQMLAKIQAFADEFEFSQVFPISALDGDGVRSVIDALKEMAQEGPHFFDDDALTDQPERVIAAEIIREKLLNNLNDEIPHGTAVVVEKMKEREGKDIIDIDAVIYCEKASHKGMIIGKGGTMLKRVASAARQDIESFLDSKVNLQCWVKVKEDWRNRDGLLKTFGFQSS